MTSVNSNGVLNRCNGVTRSWKLKGGLTRDVWGNELGMEKQCLCVCEWGDLMVENENFTIIL